MQYIIRQIRYFGFHKERYKYVCLQDNEKFKQHDLLKGHTYILGESFLYLFGIKILIGTYHERVSRY